MQDISHLAFSWINCELATQNHDNTDNVLKNTAGVGILEDGTKRSLSSMLPTDAVSFLTATSSSKKNDLCV